MSENKKKPKKEKPKPPKPDENLFYYICNSEDGYQKE